MAPLNKDKTVSELEALWNKAKGVHNRFEPSWYLSLAYFVGEQWVVWNKGLGLYRPSLDPKRITYTDNRIQAVVRTEVAKMTKQKPTFQVIPTTADDSDQQAALVGEKILDFLWRHCKLRTRLEEVLLWSSICGAGFWKITWDRGEGKKVMVVADDSGVPLIHPQGHPVRPHEVLDQEGQLPEGTQVKSIATGDVHVEVVSPFEFYPDPIAKTVEDCEWAIQVGVKSAEHVKALYNYEMEPDTDVAPGPVEGRLFPTYQMSGTSAYKGIKVAEYWCKPNSQHPEGRHAVWAKNKMLFEGPNPYHDVPYCMFKGIPVMARFWPTSVAEQLRGPQMELNKLKSQILENVQRFGNPAILCSRQANVNYAGVPGERIDFDDMVQNAQPTYLIPPPMPTYVIQEVEAIEKAIQEISGQHEVSQATVPPGVKAASAINLLMEADDTRLGTRIYQMEEELAKGGERLLKLVAKFYTDERTVMIAGSDHQLEALTFRGAALKENTRVETQTGSMFPQSKAARQAAIQDMMQLVFQYEGQQPNKRQLAKLLKDMQAGALEQMFGDLTVDEAQINRENQRLLQGEVFNINVFDDHQLHIEGHVEMQKGPTYFQAVEMNPEIAHGTEVHVLMHRQQLMRQMNPMLPPPGPPGTNEPAAEHQETEEAQEPPQEEQGPTSPEQIAAQGGTHVKTETQVGNTKTTRTRAE